MTLSFRERFRSLLSNDYFAVLLILIAYLCTNLYVYGWDDQHLEIPLLKHLIDPSLYKGDYYVEGLSQHFSSYLYPLLAKVIKVSQIPTVYLVLFLLSRYMMFFFFFKLCHLISGHRFAALCGVCVFFLTGRTEEFLYRTFSHQELAEGFMFAGIYYFYKERFILAALIFGLAANIHAIYNLFPMIFMTVYIVLFHPQRWSKAFKAGLTFTLACLPFLLWQIPRSIHDKISGPSVPPSEWMPLYFQSCPQNFLFFDTPLREAIQNIPFLIKSLEHYVFVLMLYVFLCLAYPLFRKDRKAHVIVWVAMALITLSCIFSYASPSRFILDLNLLRNEQYIRLFVMAYMTFWAVKMVQEARAWQAFIAAVLLVFIGFNNWLLFPAKFQKNIWGLVAITVVFIVIQLKLWPKYELYLRRALIVIPLFGAFASFCVFHYQYVQVTKTGQGFWQFQRNWKDMQRYVRDHTPKEALILTPIDSDLGGFRIHSERKVIVCIRDCGIIGFDYPGIKEWRHRMDDLKDFVVMTEQPVDRAVLVAMLKYKVDYIVFMKYYEPQEDNPVLKKIYDNEVFSLFKVNKRW